MGHLHRYVFSSCQRLTGGRCSGFFIGNCGVTLATGGTNALRNAAEVAPIDSRIEIIAAQNPATLPVKAHTQLNPQALLCRYRFAQIAQCGTAAGGKRLTVCGSHSFEEIQYLLHAQILPISNTKGNTFQCFTFK